MDLIGKKKKGLKRRICVLGAEKKTRAIRGSRGGGI